MSVDTAKKKAHEMMDKSLLSLSEELKKIRTGRAQVTMLDNVRINYYGNLVPLNQAAAVSTPDAKSFLISPWEPSILKEIENGIIKADIGMAPINDGKAIRLKVPELTEERRKDLVKQVKKIVEEARVAIRMARRDANEEVKKSLKDKLVGEDDAKKAETDIQKTTDEFIKKVDAISEEKEKSIMTI
ncbi:MAG TPA: ribosome recycling factor [Pseudobdellovibrionaceae bacterium]|nr:ribosome recycling factor [Pseudobdellovibrionaceae bacterium]